MPEERHADAPPSTADAFAFLGPGAGRGCADDCRRRTNCFVQLAPRERRPVEWTDDLSPIAATDWNYDRAAHLLERAGFGGTPEEIARLAAMTPRQAVDALVDFESIDKAI